MKNDDFMPLFVMIEKWYVIEKKIYLLTKSGDRSSSSRQTNLRYRASLLKQHIFDKPRETYDKIIDIENNLKMLEEIGYRNEIDFNQFKKK